MIFFTSVNGLTQNNIELLSKSDYSYIFQDCILIMKIGVES